MTQISQHRLGRATRQLLSGVVVALAVTGLLACAARPTPTPQLAAKLTLYNWVEYLPQSVIDAFTAEYGVAVDYQAYDSPEEAVDNLRAGKTYDVVVLPPKHIPGLVKANLLAPIDYHNVPNFKNISANFRDLLFDPGNKYSIPFHWGTTGLLVRTDLVQEPITRWADLWRPEFAGKVALWPIAGSLMPIALKSLGYGVNTTDPAELEQALQRLIELKRRATIIGNDNSTVIPMLAEGQAVIAYGWAYDAQVARQKNLPIEYILPEEGTFLWGDNFVIPASSPNKNTAEVFLNFLLRPEISARIVEESSYAMANEAAEKLIKPDVLDDPLIFPPADDMREAEIVMALDANGQNLYDDFWARFLAAK